MQVNNMRKQHQNTQDRDMQPLLVCALGFGAALEQKLALLFQQPSLYKNTYRLVSPTVANIDVLLVNYDNPLALRKKDILLNSLCVNAHIVAVSQEPLNNAPLYHIGGVLTAARLMAVLAKIPSLSIAEPVPAPSATLLAYPTLKPYPKSDLAANPPQRSVASQPQYRALIVDDSLAIQKSLELKLSALDQISGIDFADNGLTALAMAEANHYDLIFLDVMMPGIDGYETCTRLRNSPRYKKTPIIMVSGKTSPLDEVKGVMAGSTTYLTKPVQEDAFQKLSVRVLAWLTTRTLQEQNQHDATATVQH